MGWSCYKHEVDADSPAWKETEETLAREHFGRNSKEAYWRDEKICPFCVGERFFLDRDPFAHWYIVPEEKRAEWRAWCDLDENDERAWEAPPWVRRLNGHPARLTFSLPAGAFGS